MKKSFLLLLFIGLFMYLSAQHPSNCIVNPMLYQYYDMDVKDATLRWAFECDSTYRTDSIAIPTMIEDSIWGALSAVFNVQNMPERDSVIDMYCIHQTVKNAYIQELFIIVDHDFSWTQHWFQGELITGIPIVDSLIKKYNYRIMSTHPSIEGVVFKSIHEINLRPLCTILEKVDGIKFAEPNFRGGDGHRFSYKSIGTDRFLYFDKAWGDCMAGCYAHHIWQFKVDEYCNVEYMGTLKHYDEDESIGEPWNCNITGLMENDELENMVLSPNPAKDYVSFSIPFQSKTKYRILNINGQLVKEGSLIGDETISISELKKGIFLIQLDNQRTFKISKK